MRSNGCSISVDVTPPETPATRCSYLTWENTLIFILLALAGVALVFILIWFTWVPLYGEFVYLFLCSAQLVLLYILYIYIYVFISILYFYYLQSLASNLILKSNWNHRNSLHMAAMRYVLLLGADLGLWLLCLLLLLFLSLLLLRLLLLLLLRILIHFCLCFVVAEHIFSLWQISAVSFSYLLLLLLLLFSFKHTNMYMHAHVRVRVADEIYLVNLVRRFVSANNDFLPFAYVMLPAALFPSMMCHN